MCVSHFEASCQPCVVKYFLRVLFFSFPGKMSYVDKTQFWEEHLSSEVALRVTKGGSHRRASSCLAAGVCAFVIHVYFTPVLCSYWGLACHYCPLVPRPWFQVPVCDGFLFINSFPFEPIRSDHNGSGIKAILLLCQFGDTDFTVLFFAGSLHWCKKLK